MSKNYRIRNCNRRGWSVQIYCQPCCSRMLDRTTTTHTDSAHTRRHNAPGKSIKSFWMFVLTPNVVRRAISCSNVTHLVRRRQFWALVEHGMFAAQTGYQAETPLLCSWQTDIRDITTSRCCRCLQATGVLISLRRDNSINFSNMNTIERATVPVTRRNHWIYNYTTDMLSETYLTEQRRTDNLLLLSNQRSDVRQYIVITRFNDNWSYHH